MKEKIDVLLNNINGYPLDNEQRKVVTSCEKHLNKLYEKCQKLIDKAKLPFYKSLNKWQMLLISTFDKNSLTCDICGNVM